MEEHVYLIHGLAGNRLDMWPIARRLRKAGYQVHNWNYRTLGRSIETHANRLIADLKKIDEFPTASQLHIVTHSMGGIVLRAALSRYRVKKLAKVVMLAPPHRGSHVARFLTPFLGWLTPSLGQLADSEDSFVNQLPNPFADQNINFGIIEAGKDRVIRQGNVLLSGYRDYVKVDGQHGILTWYPKTISLVEKFLKFGAFSDAASKQKSNSVADQEDDASSNLIHSPTK